MTIFFPIVAAIMSVPSLLAAFSTHLRSPQFLDSARHPEHARAFTRERKLPLPALVAVMLSGMRKSIQAESTNSSPTSTSKPNWPATYPSAPSQAPVQNCPRPRSLP